MKVIFFGFQTWGYKTLLSLLQSPHQVPLVITHPTSKHCYETIWNDSVKTLALEHNIPVIECQYANTEEIIRACAQIAPDVMILSNWRTWMSPEVFTIPRFGALNIHDALLPKYGGFSPINWSIINGETETGVTVHFVVEELDLGDILLQVKVPILLTSTATEIFYQTLPFFSDLPLQALELLDQGGYKVIKQDKSQATFYHKRQENDSLIDWSRSNLEVYNLVRAQSDPYPNAHSYYRGAKFKVKFARLLDKAYCGTSGRIVAHVGDGAIVLCGRRPDGPDQGIVIEQVADQWGNLYPARQYLKIGEYIGS